MKAPNRITVWPAHPGLLVRRAHKPGYFAADGEPVVMTTYVRRRIRDGSLVTKKPTAPTTPKKPEPKAKES